MSRIQQLRLSPIAAAATLLCLTGAAGAASISPSSFSATVDVGASVTVNKTITLDPTGAGRVDIFFLTDDTGSMGGVITNVRNTASGLLTNLNTRFADAAFGAGSYDGDPREGVPIASPPAANLTAAYSRQAQITPGTAAALAGINTWAAGGGGDGPEANFFALHQIATQGGATDGLGTTDPGLSTGLTTGWRAGAQAVIVWFGDIVSHTTTVDQAEVIAALQANNVIVVGMNSGGAGGGIDGSGQASAITSATSGTLINNFTSVPVGDVADTIVDAIGTVTSVLDLDFFHTAGAGLGVSFTCTDPLGCDGVGGDESRTFDVTFTGLAPGIYNFIVGARGVSATESDLICVPGPGVSCDGTVIPEPGTLGLLGLAVGALALARRRRKA